MSIHSDDWFNIKRNLYAGVSVNKRVATLMLRVARIKTTLSCLGLKCKQPAIKVIAKVRLHKRGTRGGGRSKPRGSPELIMRLDKKPVRFGAMGIRTRRSDRSGKKERNRRGSRECPKAREIKKNTWRVSHQKQSSCSAST